MKFIRVMCAGRVDPAFVLRAFSRGADGVFIGACHLNECNYITHGNFQALSMVNIFRKIMKYIGLNPERLRIGFVSGSEASLFVEVVTDFVKKVKELGPLGKGEGIHKNGLKFKFEAVTKLIPYIKLVERKRLRVPFKSEQEINNFFTSDEVNGLFEELFAGKLATSQISSLLQEKPLSTQALSCEEFTSYYIDPDKCKACMICTRQCPSEAITGGKSRIHVIEQEKCTKCGTCFEVCPPRFGAVKKISGEPVPPPLPEEARIIVRESKPK